MSNTPIVTSTSTDIIKTNFDIGEAANWLGHKIKAGFNFLVDSVKWIWDKVSTFITQTAFPFVKNVAVTTFTYLRTPLGLGLVGAAGIVGTTFGSNKVDEDKDPLLKGALEVGKLAGAALLGAAGVLGIQNGWFTPAF